MICTSYFETYETAWCPGCGNFNILECLATAMNEMNLDSYSTVIVGGIGQAAKLPQYIDVNAFSGLHGRAIPAAAAIKISNENLNVIISTGDGDSYGEGGNHFIHNIRRNVDMVHLVHDNQIYGLTKGQASPTSDVGMVTDVQTEGTINIPINPLLLAISAGAGFVARAFAGRKEHLISMIKQAIEFNGYALVDIFQPCVSFNKINTFEYYEDKVYELDSNYDNTDKIEAMKKSMEIDDKIPIGVIFKNESENFHRKNATLKTGEPLVDRINDIQTVQKFINELV